MPVGLRLSPVNVDLDGFLAFVMAKGAVQEPPCLHSAEILRFRIGNAVGFVARRKDGRLTFAGAARPMVERLAEVEREERLAVKDEAIGHDEAAADFIDRRPSRLGMAGHD